MKWTVGQRIVAGYAVILLFLVVVAGVGIYTFSRTAGTFERVIHHREHSIEAALDARGAADRAVLSFLRYRLTREERFLKQREGEAAEARRTMTQLRDTSPAAETKETWEQVLGLLDAWEDASGAVIAATKAGR